MFSQLVLKACRYVADRVPYRVIPRPDGAPYLVRYYLFGRPRPEQPDGRKKGFNIFLHRFLSSDVEPELHNHPWSRSVSLILTGGYEEERRVGDDVVFRTLRPGQLNSIGANDFHRIELREEEAWTLFVAGSVTQSWGFWSRVTRKFVPWREHVRQRTVIEA